MMETMDHYAHPHPPRADDDPPAATLNDSDAMEGDEELHGQDVVGEQECEEREHDNHKDDDEDGKHHAASLPPSTRANAAPAQPSITTTSTRRASLRRHLKTSKYTNDDEEDVEGENDNQNEDDAVEATVPLPTSTSTFMSTPTPTTKRSKTKSVNGLLAPRPRKSTAGAPRIHQCMHCLKGFARRSDLQRHIRTHFGDKPFVCPDCQKRFIQISALRVHERIHSGEKPYKCPECEKCFADSSSLVRHRRVHSGERPYKCTLAGCERSFCRNVTLLKHQLREHGLESCKEDGKPYLSLLPSSERPRRTRKPKGVVNNNTSMESTSAPGGGDTGTMDTTTVTAASVGDSGSTATAVASSSSSRAPARPTRKAKNRLSSLKQTDFNDLVEDDDDHFGAHQAEEQVKSMNETLDISNTTSRRASTNSFASQRSIMNPSHSIHDSQGSQVDYGYTSKTTYGLTTVYAAKQRLGSLQLGNYHYIHPTTASNGSRSSNNVPMSSLPPSPLTSTGIKNRNGLNGGRKMIDVHAASSISNTGILNGPLTPDTPNSARSCFSAPEVGQHINVGTPLEVGGSPFTDVGYRFHSHPTSTTSSRINMNGQSRMNEVSTGTSQDRSDSNEMIGVGETYPSYHKNVNLHNGQMFIHTNMQVMEGSSHYAGPYSAGYTHSSYDHRQNQDQHHPASSTAPATQTMFIDRYNHPSYDHHHPASHQQQQHQPSVLLQQGQYDHLPTPASASFHFSNSSGTGTGTGTDKQSTAPSSVPATSPYAPSFPQTVQSHTLQPHQASGSTGPATSMHYPSSHGRHASHHYYAYGNPYAQQYIPEPPLSTTVPPTPGFYGDHLHHQIHYRNHSPASGDWALPHAESMAQKDGLGHPSPYQYAHQPHQYRRPDEQHQQQQSQRHYNPHPTTRSNSSHVRDVIGEDEHRKSSLPSAVDDGILNAIDDNEKISQRSFTFF